MCSILLPWQIKLHNNLEGQVWIFSLSRMAPQPSACPLSFPSLSPPSVLQCEGPCTHTVDTPAHQPKLHLYPYEQWFLAPCWGQVCTLAEGSARPEDTPDRRLQGPWRKWPQGYLGRKCQSLKQCFWWMASFFLSFQSGMYWCFCKKYNVFLLALMLAIQCIILALGENGGPSGARKL